MPTLPSQPDKIITLVSFTVLILPLAGFTVLALYGDAIKRDKEQRGAAWLACITVLLAFACSVYVAFKFPEEGHKMAQTRVALQKEYPGLAAKEPGYMPYQPTLGRRAGGGEGVAEMEPLDLINVGGLRVSFSLLIDQLSALMMLVVTGVGSLIHIYSVGYMAHDEERVRYFSYLNLFTFFMLLLVMGGSLPLVFVGWEGVGLCSYLLIGFWFQKQSASDAGKKAFIVNRIGDAGLILGMILAFHSFGTLDLFRIVENAGALAHEGPGEFGVATLVCLLLFVGACGKSAQIPLHVWLPDAMEGPTPVSALIHAATMVTAGVYLVARLAPLYGASDTAMGVVAVVGAVTAFMAATVALVQTDIKKVLAYSTVSQLGYMFLACGVGAFGVAVFHLFTHAFFKALLFLGSGSVIHAMSGEQDMRKMGGLWKKIPWTFGTFLIGTLAIAGIPLLAGFYSKDAILEGVLGSHRTTLFAMGMVTALLTAFYMTRLLILTFFGRFRGDHEVEHHVHESPWSMLFPLCTLAVACFVVGHIKVPEIIRPVFRLPPEAVEHHADWLKYAATTVALLGIAAAYYFYALMTDLPGKIGAAFSPVRHVLEDKYGFDLLFNWLARRVVVGGSDTVLWKGLDVRVIDGLVNGTAGAVAAASRATRGAQTGLVRAYTLVIFGGAVALLSCLLWL